MSDLFTKMRRNAHYGSGGMKGAVLVFHFIVDKARLILYNVYMNNKYVYNNTSVTMLHYHLIFSPKYRRKIFNIDGVEARFKELVKEVCGNHGLSIISLECDIDHCHIFISAQPTQAVSKIVQLIKNITSQNLRSEFEELSKMQTLWTRSYFASTAGEVSTKTIKQYIDSQKTSSRKKK